MEQLRRRTSRHFRNPDTFQVRTFCEELLSARGTFSVRSSSKRTLFGVASSSITCAEKLTKLPNLFQTSSLNGTDRGAALRRLQRTENEANR
jgi:hypothetical protein